MADKAPRTLADRLREVRANAFVGRHDELAVLRATLDTTAAHPVCYVHGPGGIGKSSLLREFGRLAAASGREVGAGDCRFLDGSPRDFEEVARPVLHVPGVVLLVDGLEHVQWLEVWLRERFLPRIAEHAVVVIAGRRGPDAEWLADPGWAELLRVLELRALPPGTSAELLSAKGVEPAQQEAVIAFAGGNPLALSLAAATAAGFERGWKPSADVVDALLSRLVGQVRTPGRRHALEVSALLLATTEDLLSVALPGEDAAALFAWLRGLPFIESGPRGLYPHDVVRRSLTADLVWRDAAAFHRVRASLATELLRQVRTAPGATLMAAAGDLVYVHRTEGRMDKFYVWAHPTAVLDDDLTPEDVPHVLRLAEEAEGARSAAIAAYWVRRFPQAFRVYRDTENGPVVGFSAWLALSEPVVEDIVADPVVAAAWEHSSGAAAPRPGEHIGVARFSVEPRCYQRTSPVLDLIQRRAMAEIFRTTSLVNSYIVMRDPDFWTGHLAFWNMHDIATATVEDHAYHLYAHDWRQVPVEPWLALTTNPARRQDGLLSRSTFDESLRNALRNWADADALAANPLAHSTLVPPDTGDRAAALRDALRRHLETLRAERQGAKAHAALTATYLVGNVTQEAAARRLNVPLSTYRRHLRTGLERFGDITWRALTHPDQ